MTTKEVKIVDALLTDRGQNQRQISRSNGGKCFYCQKKGILRQRLLQKES